MKIGYCVEGSTDRGFVKGLTDRWCPQAEFIEGRFRGSTGLRLRAEIPQICIVLSLEWLTGISSLGYARIKNGLRGKLAAVRTIST